MICVSVIAAITSGESIVMWGVIAIVAGNCTNSRKVIKAVLITQIVVFAITFILCGAGVIQDYILIRKQEPDIPLDLHGQLHQL